MNTTDIPSEIQLPALPQAPIPPQIPPAIPVGLRGWLTFLGMCHLSTGVLGCLSLIGFLPGIPLVIAGIALLRARTRLDDPVELDGFMQQIRTAVIGLSSLYIASLLLFLLSLIIIIPFIGIALSHSAGLFSGF